MCRYDKIIQENIEPLTLSLIKKLPGIRNANIIILPRKTRRIFEKETDVIIRFTDKDEIEVVVNVEWQRSNDPAMHERMLLQQSILYSIHKLPVIGVVIYAGKVPVNMQTEVILKILL